MDIKVSSNIVTIQGNIKSIGDYQDIKNILDALITTSSSITIDVVDSLSITSSVIGYLNKIILKDKISVSMKIGNAQLMELLSDLNLASVFNARKA